LNHISSAEAHTPGQWQQGSKQPQVPLELGTQQVLQQSQQLFWQPHVSQQLPLPHAWPEPPVST
jgi:hypothetical protein